MKPITQTRVREYAAHPVPRTARRLPHIGMHFASVPEHKFQGATGAELAEEMARPLTPWARAAVLG